MKVLERYGAKNLKIKFLRLLLEDHVNVFVIVLNWLVDEYRLDQLRHTVFKIF